jgi:hypothetical protein
MQENMNNQSQHKLKNRLSVRALLVIATLISVLASTTIFMYRDMLFRDYENLDLAGSDDSVSFLFVGNSQVFWGKVPRQLYIISKKHGVEITYKDISSNGAHLKHSKDEAIIELQSGKYDYVVLQDNTRLLPGNIDEFLNVIQLICDEAKANGAIPVLYNPAVANNNGQPDAERLTVYTEAYKRAADENNAILVNAGDSWVYAYETIPNISLYAWDGMHANNAGAFLTACVFAATLFDLHIEEIPKDNRYNGGDALDLAQAAWEFVNP